MVCVPEDPWRLSGVYDVRAHMKQCSNTLKILKYDNLSQHPLRSGIPPPYATSMAFAGAINPTIVDSSFSEIHGDQNNFVVHGNASFHDPEAGICTLRAASALGATHDSFERHPPPKCHPGTRKTPLHKIDVWMREMEKSCGRPVSEASDNSLPCPSARGRLLWLHGPAGAGKSAVAQTVSQTYAKSQTLVGSFFFSRGTTGRDTERHLFPTLAYQMAMRIPGLRARIGSAVKSDPSIFEKSLDDQLNRLIILPFQSLLASPLQCPRAPYLIILDGLDECTNKGAQCDILSRVFSLVYVYDLPICFLIVSRPEPNIKGMFRSDAFSSNKAFQEVSLYADQGFREARSNIRTFFRAEFERIHRSRRHQELMRFISTPWPSPSVINCLVLRSGGYFVYAATVIRFVDEEFVNPVERLQLILDASDSDGSPFAELDKLYHQILSANPNTDLLVQILGPIFISSPPPEVTSISAYQPGMIDSILGLQPGTARSVLGGMHSLLRVEETVKCFHASFRDFLFDKSRAGSFFIDPKRHHYDMALGFLRIMDQWEAGSTTLVQRSLTIAWSFHASEASDSLDIFQKLITINVKT
ncbi:hypothetical protein FPV67DRAFT_789138 [Lyophyllum atratum]|nr:hypothetical protein FPV67DRAFT_789138 [Lyophyllum atratum]